MATPPFDYTNNSVGIEVEEDEACRTNRANGASSPTPLCCCEYIDHDRKHFHILACCCNCQDLDSVCTSLATCRRVEPRHLRGMLLTFQDRLRLPWRGGARQISMDRVLPMVGVPLVIGIAAINVYSAVIITVATISFLGYAYHCVRRAQIRTQFFFMWLLWSLVAMFVLFELKVPLLELLPEEKIALVLFTLGAIGCMLRTRQRAALNHVQQSGVAKDELPDIAEASEEQEAAETALLMEETPNARHTQPNICDKCRKYVPPRTAHCSVCGACIMRRDHHSYWLDCCIGEWNHRYYVAALILAEIALLLGADLTLTAVCHPFLVARVFGITLMIPDDCSEVFDNYELALAFVIAVYALAMAVYVFAVLMRQVYLISRGVTLQESQRGYGANRKTLLGNWRAFIV